MTMMFWVYLALAVTCLVIYQCWFHPLSHISGPFISKFIPLVKIKYIFFGKLNSTRKKLHDTYGPIVRISPGEVSFATVTSFDTIYGFVGDKYFDLTGSSKGLFGAVGDLTSGLSNVLRKEDRQELRALMTSTLSDLSKGTGEELLDATFREIFDKHKVGRNSCMLIPLDQILTEVMWLYGSRLAFGIPGSMTHFNMSGHVTWLDRYFCFLECNFCLFARPTVQAHCKWFYKAWQAICYVMGQPLNPPPTMDGSIFLKPISPVYPDNHFMRLKEAAQRSKIASSFSDSTLMQNAALTWFSVYGASHQPLHGTFLYLLQNLRCLQKLEQELLTAYDTVAEVKDKTLATLPYLNACINEGLRLVAPFNAGILQRISLGATVDGVYLPKGVAVATDVYTIAHSAKYWEAPEEFIPERWLGQSPKDEQKASRPFLIGSRACPGRQLALQMFRMFVAKILYSYKLELVNKDFNIHRDCYESFMWSGIKMHVRAESRFDDRDVSEREAIIA